MVCVLKTLLFSKQDKCFERSIKGRGHWTGERPGVYKDFMEVTEIYMPWRKGFEQIGEQQGKEGEKVPVVQAHDSVLKCIKQVSDIKLLIAQTCVSKTAVWNKHIASHTCKYRARTPTPDVSFVLEASGWFRYLTVRQLVFPFLQ